MASIKCTQVMPSRYVCLVDDEPYIVKKIYVGNQEYSGKQLEEHGNYKLEGDILKIEKENFENGIDEISFMREYYSKKIPSPEDMKKAKEIRSKYNTPEKKQEFYLKIIGGRPKDSICIYDILPEEDFISKGYEPKRAKKIGIWEFEKKKNGKTIKVMVDNYDEDEYRVGLIRIYTKNKEITPICVNNKGEGITITGKVR